MKQKLLHSLVPLFGILLFLAAFWILQHELQEYHYHDIVHHIGKLPSHQVFLAPTPTILDYLIVTRYDALVLSRILTKSCLSHFGRP